MSATRLFEVPIRAWHSVTLYQEVAVRWTGLNVWYLFLFLFVCWFPWIVKEQSDLNRYSDEWVQPLISELPRFGFTAGKLWVEGEPRRTISDPKTGRPLLLIDTTGQTRALESNSPAVLVTADALIVRTNDDRESRLEFNKIPNSSVSPQEVRSFVEGALPSLVWFSYPALLVGSYLFRLLQVFLLALAGLIICPLLDTELPLPALIRISVVALTPAMTLRALCSILEVGLPFSSVIFSLLTIGYLVFGISVNKLGREKGLRNSRPEW